MLWLFTFFGTWHFPRDSQFWHICMVTLGILQLQTDQKGVLIRRIEPTAPVNKSLKKGDILLSFDGVDIANDGTVPFRSGERISFNYLVSRKYTNEEVTLCLSMLTM